MLKVEANAKNGEIRTEVNGPEPLVYAEMGIAIEEFYQTLCRHNPKKRAKWLMRRLIESSLMEYEEMEKELARRREEEPELVKTAER